MKEITTNGITILLVEVPEDATKFVTDWKFLIVDIFSPTQKMIPIPEGQYQILGKSTELSEEQMKEICEKEYFQGYFQGFCNYMSKQVTPLTVQESYLSLLEANGMVDRCDIKKPDEDYYMNKSTDRAYSRALYRWKLEQWQEAQSKIKHYLVLKSI